MSNNNAVAIFTHLQPPSCEFRLQPENLGDGSIKMCTKGSYSHRRVDKLSEKNPACQKMKEAFQELKRHLQDAYGNEKVERMTIDIDQCLVTVVDQFANRETKTIGEIKEAIAEKKNMNKDNVEHLIGGYFSAFKTAFHRSGIGTIEHYSPFGRDKIGSAQRKRALTIERGEVPSIVVSKQAVSLAQDQQKRSHTIATFVEHNFTPTHRCDAMKKVINAEAFVVRLQKELKARIRDQQDKKADGDAIRNTKILLDALSGTNRHALWVAAISENPMDCYDKLLKDFYEDLYGKKDDTQRPTYEQFRTQPESLPFRNHAAQVASTLTHTPKEYRLFCIKHGIPPCQYHVNAFLTHVLKKPEAIDFSHFDLDIKEHELDVLKNLMIKARDNSDFYNEVAKLKPEIEAPAELLKLAFKNQRLSEHLRDESFRQPSWLDKARSWFPGAAPAPGA